MKIERALISVSDKTDLIPFAAKLQQQGVEIISTGGTAQFLHDHHIHVTSLSSVTNFPEILGWPRQNTPSCNLWWNPWCTRQSKSQTTNERTFFARNRYGNCEFISV